MALALATLAIRTGEAHKPITSPYTYNEDVFPILRDRCGRCHVPGGIAPMSLMTYKDAYPWGESIRTELIAGHMPPWHVDEQQVRFRNAHALSARDLNILLTWVTGGNPIGNPEHTVESVALARTWPAGTPDLVLPWPSEFAFGADKNDETAEIILKTGLSTDKWIRAVDLMPGTPSIVRSATISVAANPSTDVRASGAVTERILALWLPGEDPVAPGGGARFRLPASAELSVRVHYKKTWEYERRAMTDQSSVGLYFAAPPASEIRALTLASSDAKLDRTRVSFNQVVEEDFSALALHAAAGLAHTTLRVTATRPDGTRADLIHMRPQPDWNRRYWFEQPVALPRGTRLEVAAAFDPPLLPPGAVPIAARPVDKGIVKVTLDVVGR